MVIISICAILLVYTVFVFWWYVTTTEKRIENFSAGGDGANDMIQSNIVDYIFLDNNDKSLITVKNDSKIFVTIGAKNGTSGVVIKSNIVKFENINKIMITNTTVRCQNDAAMELFKTICVAYNIDYNKYKFTISGDDSAAVNAYFDTEENIMQTLRSSFGNINNLVIYDYESLEHDKISFFFPIVRFDSFQINNNQVFDKIFKVIRFDDVVYATSKDFKSIYKDVFVKSLVPMSVQSLYSMYFRFYKEIDAIISNQNKLQQPIKESFENGTGGASAAVRLNPSFNIDGELKEYIGKIYKRFVCNKNAIASSSFKLAPGDIILLDKQTKNEENDLYYVLPSTEEESVNLVTAYPQELNETDFEVLAIHESKMLIKNKTNLPPFVKLYDRLYFYNIGMPAVVLDYIDAASKSPPTFKILVYDDDIRYINKYVCATNPELLSKEACLSDYEEISKRHKKTKDVWDRQCEVDSDCPFFSYNKEYPVSRGGCHNGFCEMPIGVARVGYRKYILNQTSFPYCHNCSSTDLKNIDCCAKQESPDYAFPFDHFYRFDKYVYKK